MNERSSDHQTKKIRPCDFFFFQLRQIRASSWWENKSHVEILCLIDAHFERSDFLWNVLLILTILHLTKFIFNLSLWDFALSSHLSMHTESLTHWDCTSSVDIPNDRKKKKRKIYRLAYFLSFFPRFLVPLGISLETWSMEEPIW